MFRWTVLALAAAPAFADTVLNSFETADDLAMLRPSNVRIETVDSGVTEGRRALRVEFLPAQWPNILFRRPVPWDFRGSGELALEITNPGEQAVTFSARIDDDLRADGTQYCRTATASIEPGATRTVAFPFGTAPPIGYGMRGLPTYPGTRAMAEGGSGWKLDFSHIVQFQIFLSSPRQATTLIVDNVRLRPSYPLAGIVDAFGQFTGAKWPGKLFSIYEFDPRRSEEEADWDAAGPDPERDRFGGWAAGPVREATGWFRVEKIDGKWWLVTPDGTLFFSTGFNATRPAMPTYLTGREDMFSWLPEPGDPLTRYFGAASGSTMGPVTSGRTFDFYAANLERKYGAARDEAWLATVHRRIRAWGFNTIGNWSDTRLWGAGTVYVTTSDTSGAYNRVPTGTGPADSLPDPWDPRFATAVAARVAYLSRTASDPWLLGHFVDNELHWGANGSDVSRYAAALGALGQKDTPARAAIVAQLQAKYGDDVGRLSAAWATSFASWDALAAPKAFNAAARADLGEFVTRLAREYFRIVRDAVKARDPNHLYLGSRFASYTTEVVNAAAEIVDVVSFNIYRPRIDSSWSFLNGLGKPCIIGEFHFGALDRGMFHTGLVAAPDQDTRAWMYGDYLGSVLDHPAFVGAHWFEYVDEPITGRTLDGENYNIGFVTVVDAPYPEMVQAARTAQRRMYRRRAGLE